MTEDPAVRLLRETLGAHESEAPEPDDLANAARSRAAEAGRTWWSGVAAAAAVVLVATGIGAALVRGGNGGVTVGPASPSSVAAVTHSPAVSTPGSAAPQPAVDPTSSPLWVPTRPPPDGWKLVSSLGVELAVPKAWPVVGAIAGCGPLPVAVVERGGGGVRGCGYVEPATFTLVQIERRSTIRASGPVGAPSTGDPSVGAAGDSSPSPHPLNRMPASFTERTLTDGRTELVVSFEDRDTAVLVRGPDKALIRTIFGTVQPADLDVAGCAAVPAGRPDWDRTDRAAAAAVDVGDAVGVSVCAYSSVEGEAAPRLAASTKLDGGAAVPVIEALRSAPRGRNPDADAANCLSNDAVQPTLLLVLHRQDTSDHQVWVHYDGCRDRYVADAGGQSRVTMTLLQVAYGSLGMGFGVMNELR